MRKEPLGDSAVWAGLFKDFNKPFGGPTGFEWLSRDPSEVKKYVDDPLCGFAFSNELARDIFVGFARMRDPALEARIPKSLPVLVIQGELDPVGENLVGTRRLVARYQGARDVAHRDPLLHGCAARVAERDQPRRGPARRAGVAGEDGLSGP